MKKIFTLVFCLVFLLAFNLTFATIHNVSIINDNAFSPNSFNAVVGDTIIWTSSQSDAVAHTTTSVSIPGGAPAWDHTLNSPGDAFTYVITTPGVYNYHCTFHLFTGSFNVGVAAGIPSVSSGSKLVFPNPFTDRVTMQYNQAGSVMIYNILGNKVADVNLTNPNQPVELNLQNLRPGVYFIALVSEGVLVETRKVIKQ